MYLLWISEQAAIISLYNIDSLVLIAGTECVYCAVRTLPLSVFLVLVSMVVKHNNVLLNLITGCLYWLTTCFGQLHDHHQVYKS